MLPGASQSLLSTQCECLFPDFGCLVPRLVSVPEFLCSRTFDSKGFSGPKGGPVPQGGLVLLTCAPDHSAPHQDQENWRQWHPEESE